MALKYYARVTTEVVVVDWIGQNTIDILRIAHRYQTEYLVN